MQLLFILNGAEGGTRTRMDCSTRPSSVRVYQFHHLGISRFIILATFSQSSLQTWNHPNLNPLIPFHHPFPRQP